MGDHKLWRKSSRIGYFHTFPALPGHPSSATPGQSWRSLGHDRWRGEGSLIHSSSTLTRRSDDRTTKKNEERRDRTDVCPSPIYSFDPESQRPRFMFRIQDNENGKGRGGGEVQQFKKKKNCNSARFVMDHGCVSAWSRQARSGQMGEEKLDSTVLASCIWSEPENDHDHHHHHKRTDLSASTFIIWSRHESKKLRSPCSFT